MDKRDGNSEQECDKKRKFGVAYCQNNCNSENCPVYGSGRSD